MFGPVHWSFGETSLLEVNEGIIESAQAMGATPLQIIFKFILPEARSSLILNLTTATISLIGATAMAGAVGAGGIGDLAISYGYQRFDTSVVILTVIVLLIMAANCTVRWRLADLNCANKIKLSILGAFFRSKFYIIWQTKLLKAITMKITTLLISLSLLPMLSHAASNPYNYVTSVKVNQVELNAPVTAHQVSQLLAPPNGKTSKQYAECTGNYEYSITTAQPKTLKFENF